LVPIESAYATSY